MNSRFFTFTLLPTRIFNYFLNKLYLDITIWNMYVKVHELSALYCRIISYNKKKPLSCNAPVGYYIFIW